MLTPDEYNAIHAYLQATSRTPVKTRRVRAITVNPAQRHLPKLRLEVGQLYADLEPGAHREKILAIFESASFLVVTGSRGAGNTPPYYFSREDVRRVEYSDLDEHDN